MVKVIPPVPYTEYKGLQGIVLPEKYEHGPEDRIKEGAVVALGPSITLYPETVHEGDTVLFGKWAGAKVMVSGKEHALVKAQDLLAVRESS